MKPLTDPERRALHQASRKLGATICPPFRKLDKGQVTRVTADKLVAAGYATLLNGYLRVTDAGKHALEVPVPEQPVFLAARMQRGYTSNPAHGALGEPQVMDKPSETWQKAEQEARAAAKLATREGRRAEASRLARLAKQASHRNWPTSGACGPVESRNDPSVIKPEFKKAA